MAAKSPSAPQARISKSESDNVANTARLDLAVKIWQAYHNAIWEEQKHFTWLISIILSAQAVVLAGIKLSSSERAILISLASTVGILIAATGFRVQRIEAVYYCQANSRLAKEYKTVFRDADMPYYSQVPNRSILGLVLATLAGRSGIRDQFQFLFLSFVAVFVAIAAYALVAL
jgi:hypothetical protein